MLKQRITGFAWAGAADNNSLNTNGPGVYAVVRAALLILIFLISLRFPQILEAQTLPAANPYTMATAHYPRFQMPETRYQPGRISMAAASNHSALNHTHRSYGAFPFLEAVSYQDMHYALFDPEERSSRAAVRDTVPHPRTVMFRSMMLPGWGQVTNRQIWKVPLVYGLLGGITFFSISSHNSYTDYKAAYYNAASGNDDQRFGPTPAYLEGAPPESLRFNRNFYRNRRDFSFILIGLAYGLNILDAYIFAHFRDFDVSDDLTSRYTVQPDPLGNPYVSVRYRIRF
jgi:hypothetical protein